MNITAEEFNKNYPVGTKVRYWPVQSMSKHEDTTTRTEAWTLGSGHPVVSVVGRCGGVSLDNIEVIDPKWFCQLDGDDDAVIASIDQVIAMRKEIESLQGLLNAAHAVGMAKTKETMELKNALAAALDMLSKWSVNGGPLDNSHYGLTNDQQHEFDWLWTKIDNLVGDNGEYAEVSDEPEIS